MAAESPELTTKEMAAIRKLLYSLGDPNEEGLSIIEAAAATVERVEAAERMAQNAETTAQSALGVAQARGRADGGQTKKETAATKTRNELVRRAVLDKSGATGAHVTVADVKRMCRPELTVYQQTVEDAWDDLVARWRCFERSTNEEDVKALKIDKSAMTEELVGAVEQDLDRDDLSKRLLSRKGGTA